MAQSRRIGVLAGLAVVGFATLPPSCQSPPDSDPLPALTHPAFRHLAERYDSNRDNKIEPHEYGRTRDAFARLDRNGDGVLVDADFDAEGRRVRALVPAEARRHRGRLLAARYLVAARSSSHAISAVELADGLGRYDHDGDGQVGRREFEARLARLERPVALPVGSWAGLIEPETTDPWERLLEGLDDDRDGFLTAVELREFHSGFEPHWWDPAAHPDLLPSTVSAHRGSRAPDFDLPRFDQVDGTGQRVRLQETLGRPDSRPVALVFGSYT